MTHETEVRSYLRQESIVFRKTKEAYGGLSNMAAGYPLMLNGVRILTSEALYQACRFPSYPGVQKLIIDQASPMSAKMVGKPYRKNTREDWDEVRVNVMRWCLRVKLAQHWDSFGELLKTTGALPIVEESVKDPFWGAKPIDDDTLRGKNVLGRLLMELRERLSISGNEIRAVAPLQIPDFKLLGSPIGMIEAPARQSPTPPKRPSDAQSLVSQMSFDLFNSNESQPDPRDNE